jgi:hypothetical protein
MALARERAITAGDTKLDAQIGVKMKELVGSIETE